VDQDDKPLPPSLAEERLQVTRDRITRAAMEVVARRGFAATVDEIADVSGVSPRTIFRHYGSHDQLIASTVKDMYEACGLPRLVDDIERWIEELPFQLDGIDDLIDTMAVEFHTRSAGIFGAAFWDIHAPHEPSGVLSDVDALRREYRVRGMGHGVRLLWQAAGGVGEPPEDLGLAFALNLSAFTTQALMVDFDQTPQQIGHFTADILKTLIHRAVAEQRAAAEGID
jgi:AcrR family transcriptional regulator